MENWTRMPRLRAGTIPTGNGKDNRTFAVSVGMMYNGHSKQAEVKMMSDKIKFETFVDAQGTAFQEYLSTVIAKLPKTDKDYRSIQDKIESIYKQYPKVMDVFDEASESHLACRRRRSESISRISVMTALPSNPFTARREITNSGSCFIV